MAKHKHWLKRNDSLYTHDHEFIVVSLHSVNDQWVVQRIEANDRSILKTFSTKLQAQKFMAGYVRSHPNG